MKARSFNWDHRSFKWKGKSVLIWLFILEPWWIYWNGERANGSGRKLRISWLGICV